MYEVGQILVLCTDKNKIVPVQIVEEIVKKSMSGLTTSWNIMLPDNAQTVVALDEVKTVVFSSLEEFENHLLNQARDNFKKASSSFVQLRDAAFQTYNFPNEANQGEVIEDNGVISIQEGDTKYNIDLSGLEKVGE